MTAYQHPIPADSTENDGPGQWAPDLTDHPAYPQHQSPGSPPSVCWMLDLRAHGAVKARWLHPITDAASQPPEFDIERRRATD